MVMSAQWDKREVKGVAQRSNITMPVLKKSRKSSLIHKPVNCKKTYCISALLRTICFQAATRWLNTTFSFSFFPPLLFFNKRSSLPCSLFLFVLMLLRS